MLVSVGASVDLHGRSRLKLGDRLERREVRVGIGTRDAHCRERERHERETGRDERGGADARDRWNDERTGCPPRCRGRAGPRTDGHGEHEERHQPRAAPAHRPAHDSLVDRLPGTRGEQRRPRERMTRGKDAGARTPCARHRDEHEERERREHGEHRRRADAGSSIPRDDERAGRRRTARSARPGAPPASSARQLLRRATGAGCLDAHQTIVRASGPALLPGRRESPPGQRPRISQLMRGRTPSAPGSASKTPPVRSDLFALSSGYPMRRVLVVDDEENIRLVLKTLLQASRLRGRGRRQRRERARARRLVRARRHPHRRAHAEDGRARSARDAEGEAEPRDGHRDERLRHASTSRSRR